MEADNEFEELYDRLVEEHDKLVDDNHKLTDQLRTLLTACKKAYLKHHLNDEEIGWDELSSHLHTALCEVMGDEAYQKWVEREGKRVRGE